MIVADTSALLAYYNADDRSHAGVAAAIDLAVDPLVVSPLVIAELDYLVTTRFGVSAELAMIGQLASGAYELAAFGEADLADARDVVERYRDQNFGVTDASLVVLAARYGTRQLLTLDHRHFQVVRSLSGEPFELLP
ncbi:MAG TPA: PIN domain-containing protein [Dermatophilaceae bacterium]|nr:PIN domain-containing protein [Dermatophilaceae bacterium]